MSNVDYTLLRKFAARKLANDVDRIIAPAEICRDCKGLKRVGYDCATCAKAKETPANG